jgi:hypothetical protein
MLFMASRTTQTLKVNLEDSKKSALVCRCSSNYLLWRLMAVRGDGGVQDLKKK